MSSLNLPSKSIAPQTSAWTRRVPREEPSAQTYDLIPKVVEGPRFREVTRKDLAKRAVPLSGSDLATALRPELVKHVGSLNADLMAYHNQFLDHYTATRERDPKTTPLNALKSFRIDTDAAIKKFGGGNCGGLSSSLLGRVPEAKNGYVIGSVTPRAFIEPGIPLPNHMAALVPFANPKNATDRGFVLLEPGFQIPEPVVIRRGNDASDPVVYRHKGSAEEMRFFFDKELVVCERRPLTGTWDPQKIKDNALLFRTDEFKNPNETVSNSMVAVHQNPRIIARDDDGAITAVLAVNLKRKQVNLTWGSDRAAVPFASVDADGRWLANAAPRGDLTGFAKALHLPAQTLARRVDQIVRHEDVFAALRDARLKGLPVGSNNEAT